MSDILSDTPDGRNFVQRRRLIAGIAVLVVGGGINLNTSLQSGRGAVTRTGEDKMRDVVNVADFKIVPDANDTASFTRALAAHNAVYAPAGTYVVENLDVPSGRTLYGDGAATILKLPAASIFRVIVCNGVSNVTIRDLTLDAGGIGTSIALFTTCSRVSLQNIWATGSASHGIELDNCDGCKLDGVEIYSTGGASSSAAIYLKNATGNGSGNLVKNVKLRLVNGRGIHNLGNNGTQISDVYGEMTNGEILLVQDSTSVISKGITMIGDEPASAALSDGIAIEGNCLYCVLDGFHVSNNAGHGVSLGNRSGATGASYCSVSNGTVINSDEVGVAITDQGVTNPPVGNIVSNVVVRNAGKQIASPAFNVSGGADNQFIGCTALDSQRTPTTTYGFQENSTGANTAARNSFEGPLIGTFTTAAFAKVAATTRVVDTVPIAGTTTLIPAALSMVRG